VQEQTRNQGGVARLPAACKGALLVAAMASLCPAAHAERTYSVGLAAGAAPRYAGSRDYRVVGAPVLRADFGNGAFIDMLQGAGYTYKFGNGMFATASLGYALGRTDKNRVDLPGSDHLKGMGDIRGSLMGAFQLGARVYGDTTLSVTLDAPLTHRERGLSGHIDLVVPVIQSGAHMVTLGPSVHYGSGRYMQTLFGVTDAQAANSAFSAYAPKAGFDAATLSLAWNYTLSKEWSVRTLVAATRLLGDAAKSPIVQSKQSYFGMSSINYTF